MDGLIILNSEVVPAVAEQNYWWVGIIIFVIIFMAGLLLGVTDGDILIGIIVGAVIGGILGIIIGLIYGFNPNPAQPEYIKYEFYLI